MANLDRTEKLIKVNVADDAHREQALGIVGRMKEWAAVVPPPKAAPAAG
jgi:hypothetical protein